MVFCPETPLPCEDSTQAHVRKMVFCPPLIPPEIINTPLGDSLVLRMVADAWSYWHLSSIDEQRKKDVPVAGLLKVEQLIGGEAVQPSRYCMVCNKFTRRKCSHCLITHYCSRECQCRHWHEHKANCKVPGSKVQQHIVVAVPDYACFWQYQEWLGRQNSHDKFGIVIMARPLFEEMFGEKCRKKTILHLAMYGKPSFLLTDIYSLRE